MVPLPSAVQDVIVSFAPLFSKRVFAHVKVLIAGAILAPGKRTVTSVLRVMGKGDEPHFQSYHRVLNRARWSALHGGKILLRLPRRLGAQQQRLRGARPAVAERGLGRSGGGAGGKRGFGPPIRAAFDPQHLRRLETRTQRYAAACTAYKKSA